MDRKLSGGFTLLELLVALAVAGILLGIGVPSFVQVLKNGRLSTQHTDLLQSLSLARSEAIKGTADVVVCARSTDTTCSTNPLDWKNGWLVFAEVGFATDISVAQVDADDLILRVAPPLSSGNYIIAEGSANGTIGGITDRPNRSRALNVVATGDARRARATSGPHHTPLNVFGQVIDCE